MLEIQPSWGAQLDLDLQQHREQLHLRGPAQLLPLGRLRLDYQSLSPGYHALLWLSLQVRALKKGPKITIFHSLIYPWSGKVLELKMFQKQCSGASLSDH